MGYNEAEQDNAQSEDWDRGLQYSDSFAVFPEEGDYWWDSVPCNCATCRKASRRQK